MGSRANKSNINERARSRYLSPQLSSSKSTASRAKSKSEDDGLYISYSAMMPYTPSSQEAGWLASADDFETDSGLKGTYIFVGTQLCAALSLAYYAWEAKDPASMQTATWNIGRNAAWLGSHMSVSHLPNIISAPERLSARALYWAALSMNLSDKAHILDKAYEGKIHEASQRLYQNLQTLRFKNLSSTFKSATEYSALSLAYNSAKTLRLITKGLTKIPKGAEAIEHSSNSLRHTAHELHRHGRKKQHQLQDKFNSKIYRDRIHSAINVAGSFGGSAVHLPQMLNSTEVLVQYGAGIAAIGYLKMGVDQWIESSRWGDIYERAQNKNASYDHKDAHMMVGYSKNGEPIKDALLKWCPSLELFGKGGLYTYEAALLQSPALGLSGLLFSGSAAYEFKEQNGTKTRYIFENAVTNLGYISDSLHERMNEQEKYDFFDASQRFNPHNNGAPISVNRAISWPHFDS